MNVSYDYYRIFYYVGKYGSFTRAAELLGNSQPNITRAVNNLEAQLGVTLFDRTRKGVRLTQEGHSFYSRISTAIEQIEAAEQELARLKRLESGFVTIGVTEIALHEVLLPVLTEFRQQYPDISIRITNESTPSAIQSLRNHNVEFALVTSPVPEKGELTVEEIRSFTEYAVASVIYNSLKDRTVSFKELQDYPLISLSEDTSTRHHHEELFLSEGLRIHPQVTASTTDQILPMVRAGLGIGFLPESMLSDDDCDLFRIKLEHSLPPRRICLVYDSHHFPSPAASLLMKCIRLSK